VPKSNVILVRSASADGSRNPAVETEGRTLHALHPHYGAD
jgi:hypothetical protein